MRGTQGLHVAAVLHSRKDQRHNSNADHEQRILPRSEQTIVRSCILVVEILKKLVDRKSETNQRRRRSNPRHQRSIGGQPRPVGCQQCRYVCTQRLVASLQFFFDFLNLLARERGVDQTATTIAQHTDRKVRLKLLRQCDNR